MPPETDTLARLRDAANVAAIEVGEIIAPAERNIVVRGLRLHYLDWGASDRPPLLFLHGGCLTAHTWDLVCLALRSEYHCLALDQRGHGDSEWSRTADYGPGAHADDIGGLIEQLGLSAPVLIGHSLGGLNAITYATQATEQLAGLVMVDVGPQVDSRGVSRIANFVMQEPPTGSVSDFVQRAQAFNPRRDPRLLRHSLLHNLRQLPDGSWTWKYDRRGISRERLALIRESLYQLRDAAPTITCPVLVVRGAESDTFGDEQAAAFAAAFPDGRWARVDNAGHTIQGDNPAELVRALAEFLTEISHDDRPGRAATVSTRPRSARGADERRA